MRLRGRCGRTYEHCNRPCRLIPPVRYSVRRWLIPYSGTRGMRRCCLRTCCRCRMVIPGVTTRIPDLRRRSRRRTIRRGLSTAILMRMGIGWRRKGNGNIARVPGQRRRFHAMKPIMQAVPALPAHPGRILCWSSTACFAPTTREQSHRREVKTLIHGILRMYTGTFGNGAGTGLMPTLRDRQMIIQARFQGRPAYFVAALTTAPRCNAGQLSGGITLPPAAIMSWDSDW